LGRALEKSIAPSRGLQKLKDICLQVQAKSNAYSIRSQVSIVNTPCKLSDQGTIVPSSNG